MNRPDFRYAAREDVPLILRFIRELADYEGLLDEVVADEKTLEGRIFDKRKAEVIFVLENGGEVGFALFFNNFSKLLGRAGIYLENLYVKPEQGIRESDTYASRRNREGARLRKARVVVS